ncbi:hypothetical protein ACO1DI_12370 [Priestia sp. 40]|uniref:hypothetical protein n=1 Tax=Priestia sp. 40 TaxID=3394459 RepID=UPI003BF6763D
MAFLDESLRKNKIISDDEFYNILARMELQELKERVQHDEQNNEIKLTIKQALNKVNEMLSEYNQPHLTYEWAKKWWRRF